VREELLSLEEVRRFLEHAWLEVKGIKLPRVLLGTSPFIGAGQFGSRSYAYWAAFYNRPERVAEVITAAVELGVRGIQPLPYPFLAEGIRRAQALTGEELVLAATIGPEDPLADLAMFEGLDVRAALVHGALTDRARSPELAAIMDEVRDKGLLAGLASHSPMRLLRRLSSGEVPRPDLLLLPFNAVGYLMDAPAPELANAIRSLRVPVMGKKVLAAGRLRPEEAFRFALGSRMLEGVAVGVVSRVEAEEAFTSLAKAALELGWPSGG